MYFNFKILLRDLIIQREDYKILMNKFDLMTKKFERCWYRKNIDNCQYCSVIKTIKLILRGKNADFQSIFSSKKVLSYAITDEIVLISLSVCFIVCKLSNNYADFPAVQNLLIFSLVILVIECLIKRLRYNGHQETNSLKVSVEFFMKLCDEQLTLFQKLKISREEVAEYRKVCDTERCHQEDQNFLIDNKIPVHQEETDNGKRSKSEERVS